MKWNNDEREKEGKRRRMQSCEKMKEYKVHHFISTSKNSMGSFLLLIQERKKKTLYIFKKR